MDSTISASRSNMRTRSPHTSALMRSRVKYRMYDPLVRCCRIAGIALGLTCSFGSAARAVDTNAIGLSKVLTGLNTPQGIAVRPDGSGEAYEVFVAESGAGRVLKIRSG